MQTVCRSPDKGNSGWDCKQTFWKSVCWRLILDTQNFATFEITVKDEVTADACGYDLSAWEMVCEHHSLVCIHIQRRLLRYSFNCDG